MGHTQEPWEISCISNNDRESQCYLGEIKGIDNFDLCYTRGHIKSLAEANAERIVTCVNACAGLTNDEVKRYGPEIRAMVRVVTEDMFNGRGYTIHGYPPIWYMQGVRGDKTQKRIYDLRSRIEGKEEV